ncbi:hypothetical protein HK104_008744 [Borealophlyctis nickersoniae]|nr:hypothetical protein HK104_008744 [Borealophlyctis nickersoniae]
MFPTELLLPIFAYADAKTTCSLSQTCRNWNDIIETNHAAIYLPKLRRVSFEAAIPPLLPGETYKDVYKIHHAWENNGRRLQRQLRSAERVDAVPPKAGGRSYLTAPTGVGCDVVMHAESAGDVVAYTLAPRRRPTDIGQDTFVTCMVHTFVLGAATESAIPHSLYHAPGARTTVKVVPSVRSDLLVTVIDIDGTALFWDAVSKQKRHQITIGQHQLIFSAQLCGDVFVAIQGDRRAKAWKLIKGQYQPTETAWEAVYRGGLFGLYVRLAVSETVVAWIEPAEIIVRRAKDGVPVGKPIPITPDHIALTRTHLIGLAFDTMDIYVHSLSKLERVHQFHIENPYRLLPIPDPQLHVSDSGSAVWVVMMHPSHRFPSPHHLVLVDMPNGRVTDWVQRVPEDQESEEPFLWVWSRGDHQDGEGGDREDEECVWMRVYG